MAKERKVIGEGSYGCVHKPSLHCLKDLKKDEKIHYTDYVSKIMITKEAQKELKEFVIIGSYDPENEYHLGTPILCQPELTDTIINKDISKCKYIKSSEVKANPNDYKILLIKFGGPDLKNLCVTQLKKYLSTKSKMKTDRFWLEVHHLLKGIKFFKDNGLVHNDIKPQNILFNMKTGKLVFIDFGLMRSKQDIVSSSKKSTNFLGIYHWSYPFDCGLMNKDKYDAFKGLSVSRKNAYKTQLSEMIIKSKGSISTSSSNKNTFEMSIKNPGAFNILFNYINPDGTTATKHGYIEHFFDGMNNLISKDNYDANLDRIVNSIDVYGLGFTLQFILNCFYEQHALNLDFFTRLSTFFHKMYDFNPETREINIDNLINEYENILLEIGVLTRLKKSFVNNTIVNKNLKLIRYSNSRSNSKSLSHALEKFETLDPNFTSPDTFDKLQLKQCPPEKELNIVTNRCVKKCKPGQTRNSKFRCVNKNTKKHRKNKN
jgi:serine/threonine protein kinase